jgi:hypothetical protein
MRSFLSGFLQFLMPTMALGGGGGDQSNEFKPPEYTVQGWKDYLSNAQSIAQGGLQPYGGQTVADLTPMTGGGLQMLSNYAMNGTPERSAAGAALIQQMQGGANPYATMANPYAGDNPYLQSMLQNSNDLIAQNFAKGTAAQTDSAAARSGAFGGSAYNQMTQDNARTLAGSIAANTNNLLSNQYNQSANMAENALNRATGAYDTSQGRALQAAGTSQGQQGLDLQAIQALIAGGQVPQQYQQQLLNAAQNYYQQGQQAPFTLSDFLGGALGRASGTYGTNTQVGGGASPLAGLLGAGAAGYGLFGGG